ncbi:MAG: hypothetical protein NTV49_08095, partial [Kiritimatiellaeota bacterium]|nr:hypothetical protein [Kiritimatiellota bacterium]
DWQEFVTGTDPTNRNSCLVVSNATPQQGDAGFTIQWPAVPGKTYQVEYCDALGEPWQEDLPGSQLTAGAGQTTLTYTDTTAGASPRRTYRAMTGGVFSPNGVGYAVVQVPPAGGYALCGLNFMPGGNDPTTLPDLLGTNQLVRNSAYTLASQVLLWDSEAQGGAGGYLAVFQKPNGNFYLTQTPTVAVIPGIGLGEALWIQSPKGATATQTVLLAGDVPTDPVMPQFVPAGLSMFANPYAAPLDLNDTNLHWVANGATARNAYTLADQLCLWTGTGYNNLYLRASDQKWHYQSGGLLATNAVIAPGAGAWYKAKQAVTNWIVRPYPW